ncbi:hypothetical protein AHAS_Ahas19G0126500 [Arachis hypogaea]
MLAKYMRGNKSLELVCPMHASEIWRTITKAARRLKEGFVWCTGPLTQSFWYHPWRPSGTLAQEVSFVHISDTLLSLGDVWFGGGWHLEGLYTVLPESLKLDITSHHPSLLETADPNCFRSSRNLTITDICPRCNEAPETAEHCLRFCIKVQPIWKRLEVGVSIRDAFLEFRAWLRVNLRATEAIFAAGLWWIWRYRNNDIFNPKDSWSMEKVLMLARHSAAEYGIVKCTNQVSSLPSLIDSWCPPPLHVVKLNCDASLFEQQHLTGFGCVLRNDSGKWLAGCSASIPTGSITWCELYAIWRGLCLAWDCGNNEIICETDCLEAYLLITKDFAGMRRNYNDLLLKIAEMMQRNWVVHVHLIQRIANTAADLLARTVARHSLPYIEYLVPSLVVQEIIRKEMSSPT